MNDINEKLIVFLLKAFGDCENLREKKTNDLRKIINSTAFDMNIRNYHLEEGASKRCIIFDSYEAVVKWSYDYNNKTSFDEAFEEVTIYQKAIEKGLECFFPKTEFLTEIQGVRFVVQERVSCSVWNTPDIIVNKTDKIIKTVSSKTVEKVRQEIRRAAEYSGAGRARTVDARWISTMVSIYGKKKVKRLTDFMCECGINDLHSENIGYIGKYPIILDFSGYKRDA